MRSFSPARPMGSSTCSAPGHRTRRRNAGFRNSSSRRKRGCSGWCSTTRRSRKRPAAMPITTPMGRSVTSSALPRGLRMVRHRRKRPIWLVAAALIGGGVAVGGAASGAPSLLVMGAIGAVVVIAAAVVSPALGLAGLAFMLPFDQPTHAGPIPLTTSDALIGLLVLVWVIRQVLPNAPALHRTPLDILVLVFAGVTILTLAGFNPDTQLQLMGIAKAIGGIVMFFLATQSLRVRNDIWLVIGAVIVTGLIQA